MKFILRLFIIILFLLIIIICSALFLPNERNLTASIEIPVSHSIVFEQMENTKHWPDWMPWILDDTDITLIPSAKTEGQGASLEWKSNVSGNSVNTITHSNQLNSIAIKFDYENSVIANALFLIDTSSAMTNISVEYEISHFHLFEKILYFFSKNKITTSLHASLENLKQLALRRKYCRLGDITLEDLEPQGCIAIRDTATENSIYKKKAEQLKRLDYFFERRESIEKIENPICIRYSPISESISDFAMAYRIEKRTWIWKNMQYTTLTDSLNLRLTHLGGRNINKAYQTLEKYMHENTFEANGYPWEEYIIHAQNEPDTSLWQTVIYYPVRPRFKR